MLSVLSVLSVPSVGSVGKFSNNKIGGVVSVLLLCLMTAKYVLQGTVRFVGIILPYLARYLDFTLDISVRARYLALLGPRLEISSPPRYLAPNQDILVGKISWSGPRYFA